MLTDEEAQIWAENYKKWKSKQTKFIAVEMTISEMIKESHITPEYIGSYLKIELILLNDNYRIENGKLYKKSPNPYNQATTVISW